MVEGLICAQRWLRPSLMQSRDVIPSEEFKILENIVLGTKILPFLLFICFVVYPTF